LVFVLDKHKALMPCTEKRADGWQYDKLRRKEETKEVLPSAVKTA